ncbi:hypothetical protein BRADI_3g30154v3 [Brachypodium distachyon]|uniref:Glutathione S-transferase n=1 Tax=Brachypodium distachyon TaxID=15368 RepID=A0A0Q3JGF5_BRADI|nr:hypothetical protein BRADI_3g30154v3 [Brachypodium distachyon]
MPSPFVTRVKLALAFKGLSFEDVEEDLRSKSELLLVSNPVHKKVPVLIHNGKPICESLVILEYIDEAFSGTGPSLLPADPHHRAVARFWAAYIHEQVVAQFVQSIRGKTEEDKAEGIKQTFAAMETLEGALRDCSKGEGLFFGGGSVGLVDVLLGSLLSWLKAAEVISGTKYFDPVKTPLLAAWMERFSELAKAALPEVERVLEFSNMLAMAAAAAAAAASEN